MSDAPHIQGFEIVGHAGSGGMGTVYIAEQRSPRRTVALKVLGEAPNSETLAKFRQEAAVIARLEHPRIVPLYSYGEQEGVPYLVMRHLSGGSLADRIEGGPQDLGEAERWLAAIAEALDHAHQHGLVHRDVKPSNILFDESGNAHLSDFGIAGTVAEAGSGLPSGSVAYMAPEQASGAQVDGRADTYALAVTLFEALTSEQPYRAETALGVMARHMHDPIPSIRAIQPAFPLAPDELIQWGMAKQPEHRPQTSGEMARMFSHAVRHPSRPLRPKLGEGGQETMVAEKPRRRSRVGLWIALGVIAIGMVGAGLLATQLLPDDAPKATATRPAPTSEAGGQESQPSPEGLMLTDDFSNDQSGFAVLSDADGGVEYAADALRITVLTDGVRWYSPSGLLEVQDVEVEVSVRLQTGPPRGEVAVLCRWRDLENFTALAFRPDGAAAIWQLSGGELTWLQEWAAEPGGPVLAGLPVQLRAICRGPSLTLHVNDQIVAQARDSNLSSGDVVLMAGLGEPGELVAYFDDLVVRR